MFFFLRRIDVLPLQTLGHTKTGTESGQCKLMNRRRFSITSLLDFKTSLVCCHVVSLNCALLIRVLIKFY